MPELLPLRPAIDIGDRRVGPGHPCYVIAEAGVNHDGSVERGHALIDAAARAGVDAVKFQTFRADKLVTTTAPKARYQAANMGEGGSQHDMLRRLELSLEAHQELFAHCEAAGVQFLSSSFDADSADLVADLGVPAFKLGSGEITNLPLLQHIAAKGRPVLLSTGMSWLSEVEQAVQTLRSSGCSQLALFQCTSNYPSDPADANLRAMLTMAQAFGAPTGYSDHTLGNEVALAAVALGACLIEKHFTLDQSLPGPDHRASAEPRELAELVAGVRKIEAALGHGRKEPAASEADTAAVARKSLVAAWDLHAGAVLSTDMLAIKRPGTGLPPALLSYVVGRRLRVDVPAGMLLALDMLA
jgi:N,N'-diacetyllegionaminate synthase